METIPHGGRLQQARRRYPHAPAPFLDLSTGINPEAYPFTPPPPEAWTRLPEPEHNTRLEAIAADAYAVPCRSMIAAAAGTQALIHLLPRLLPQPRITVVGPTYAEHAATWSAAGALVTESPTPAGPACVLCNPNNPDGARHDPAALALRAHTSALLVVDEAFADFEPGLSLAPYLPLPNTIILRSFGKAYGLAGLRLGFAFAEPALAARIRTALGPWPVSGPALAIGMQALQDHPWRDAAVLTTRLASLRLDALLETAGFTLRGGTNLFRLAEHPKALALTRHLARSGILVRAFAHAPTHLRFGLPGPESAWIRLQAALHYTGGDFGDL